MAPQCKFWSAALWAAILAASVLCLAQDSQQDSSPNASIDPRVQIDELLQQSYEQINIKGQFQRAAEFAQQALEVCLKVGDKRRASKAMVYLAAAYGYGGRLAESAEMSEKNLALAREIGDPKILEEALNTAGANAGGFGRYEESLAYFYECLAIARKIGDTKMQYMSQLNIGEAYTRSGEPDRAEAPLRESLRLAAELKPNDLKASNPSKKGTEMALLNLGAMEAERRHYSAALKYYARVNASRPESSLWAITALQGMAEAHQHLGEPQAAIDLLQQAIPLADNASSGWQTIQLLSDLGVNQELLGDLNAALASENQALLLVRRGGGNLDSEWQIESRIGAIDRALGREQDALEHYRHATEEIERLRSVALNTEEGRAGVLAKSRETYAEMADLLYDLGRAGEALEVSERGRARGFLDMLAYARVDVPERLTPVQKERENTLLKRISNIERDLWKEDLSSSERQSRKHDLAAAEEDLDAFQIEMRRVNPQYATVHYPEPIRVRQIQEQLLDQQTVLLEFQLGDKRSLVWVVSKDGVEAAVLPSRKVIEAQVSAYRSLLTERASALTVGQSLLEIERRGHELYRALIEPIAGMLSSRHRLIVVPDGALDYLPFESLVPANRHQAGVEQNPFEYLIERFEVVYAPSASSLAQIEASRENVTRPAKTLLAFADPVIVRRSKPIAEATANAVRSADRELVASLGEEYAERGFSLTQLPYTRAEAMAIGRLFPSAQRQVYLGPAARMETLKTERLQDYRYIHFASHAFVDEGSPMHSGLLFSPDAGATENGVLQVRDVMRLKLNADLVTLSACSTGLGKPVSGEGVLGLTRAFFYAGAGNLAVSLWSVNDSATATVMTSFYRNLRRGVSQPSALREAKLSLIRGKDLAWRHPYYWAPFVLVGEGK